MYKSTYMSVAENAVYPKMAVFNNFNMNNDD